MVLYEPVDEWMTTKVHEQSMLELFYSDKAKHGFLFQLFVLQTRIQQMLDCIAANPDSVIITERCHITDREIFAKMMEKSGLLKPEEVIVYNKWYDTCTKLLQNYLKGIIYLKASPSVCVERIIKRSRPGEENITLEYIKKLHNIHESWIFSNDHKLPVAVIDANLDEHQVDVNAVVSFVEQQCAVNL